MRGEGGERAARIGSPAAAILKVVVTAEQLIRNRARLRMGDRIAADTAEVNRLKVFLQPWHTERLRRIELLTRRIELCRALRTQLLKPHTTNEHGNH